MFNKSVASETNMQNKTFIDNDGRENNFAIDGGVSIYQGSVRSNSKFIYTFNPSQHQFTVDSTVTNPGKNYDRQYLGIDVQMIYDIPSLGVFCC